MKYGSFLVTHTTRSHDVTKKSQDSRSTKISLTYRNGLIVSDNDVAVHGHNTTSYSSVETEFIL